MDWGQVNYSSARAALLEVWRGFTARKEHFAQAFMAPIYAAWLEEGSDLSILSDADVQRVEDNSTFAPERILGYQTPRRDFLQRRRSTAGSSRCRRARRTFPRRRPRIARPSGSGPAAAGSIRTRRRPLRPNDWPRDCRRSSANVPSRVRTISRRSNSGHVERKEMMALGPDPDAVPDRRSAPSDDGDDQPAPKRAKALSMILRPELAARTSTRRS